jgi:hypothetical protein
MDVLKLKQKKMRLEQDALFIKFTKSIYNKRTSFFGRSLCLSQREHAVIGQSSRPSRGWKPPQVFTLLADGQIGGLLQRGKGGKTMG